MAKKPELKAGETNARPTPRCMLYRGGKAQIFTGKAAIEAAVDDGWKDKPPKQTAQPAEAGASEAADARIDELEGFLAQASDEVDEANQRATEAEAKAETEGQRADAAEKKLAAAEKKLGNAGK